MIIIAHRGLQKGPDPELENRPDTIEHALGLGLDVEVDAWYYEGHWLLGHDKPQYIVSQSFLEREGIWVHCKCANTLYAASDRMHYFFHDKDDFTLTSKGVVWAYPGKLIRPWKTAVAVIPETMWGNDDYIRMAEHYDGVGAYAICTDYSMTANTYTKRKETLASLGKH